jgi:hypothetical protein
MQRGHYKAVTLPVLVPRSQKEHGIEFFGKRVRPFTADEVNPNTDRGKKLWGSLSEVEKRSVLAVIELLQALERGNEADIERASERLALPVPPTGKGASLTEQLAVEWLRTTPLAVIERRVKKSAQQDDGSELFLSAIQAIRAKARLGPRRLLAEEVSRVLLAGASLVLWWDGKRLVPALHCANVWCALYVSAMFKKFGGCAFAVCPKCGEPFVQQRPDQLYCTIAHREAHRVARWRAAKGNTPAVQKRSRGRRN